MQTQREQKNIKLIIEYEGTNYCGWQIQKNALSIQQEIEGALYKLTGEKISLIGAGRTDAGVHAYGQVANFYSNSNIPADKFSYALNSILPKDIIIKQSNLVEASFHARFSAKGKRYKYLILNDLFPSAFFMDRVWHVSKTLDLESIIVASKHFIGEHDYRAFCSSGTSVKDFVRTIYDVLINKQDNIISLEIVGNGFLYNMVRIITGTLVQVGLGKISPDSLPEIIDSCDRERAGMTAPPDGLYLMEVLY